MTKLMIGREIVSVVRGLVHVIHHRHGLKFGLVPELLYVQSNQEYDSKYKSTIYPIGYLVALYDTLVTHTGKRKA